MENLTTVIDDSWMVWTGLSIVVFIICFRFFISTAKEVVETYRKEKVVYYKGFKFEGTTARVMFFVVFGTLLLVTIVMVILLFGTIGAVIAR